MTTSVSHLLSTISQHIRTRRLALNVTQAEAADRAGVAYRTWRRMEKDGSASIEDLVRAAIALRCEEALAELFPEPAANSMDELLERQKHAAELIRRKQGQRARG
jgi:transcriptional regulator with XRE-family HTH domain